MRTQKIGRCLAFKGEGKRNERWEGMDYIYIEKIGASKEKQRASGEEKLKLKEYAGM
jgi:hypothetical protein